MPVTCLGENSVGRAAHDEFGLTMPTVLLYGFDKSENKISLRFSLVLERENEPFTGWMNGMVENIRESGVVFRTKLSEDTIEMLTVRFARINLLIKLPGADAEIVADSHLNYFKKGFTGHDGTTVILGVEFKGLAGHEKADIRQYVQTGNRFQPANVNSAPSFLP